MTHLSAHEARPQPAQVGLAPLATAPWPGALAQVLQLQPAEAVVDELPDVPGQVVVPGRKQRDTGLEMLAIDTSNDTIKGTA